MKDYDGITSAKIATLIEYFDSEERVDKTNPRFARAVKLQKMMDIWNSKTFYKVTAKSWRKLSERYNLIP